ncbi:MAG: hypothetical protein LC808_14125 [Actinobacteria bacterium]|nr:hypothetical protein [Actinomycetota bacterium]
MSMTPRQFITALALLLFLAGFVGAVAPSSLDQGDGSVYCGNTLTGAHATEADIFDSDRNTDPLYGMTDLSGYPAHYLGGCIESVAARRLWSWPAVVIGLVALAGALASSSQVCLIQRFLASRPTTGGVAVGTSRSSSVTYGRGSWLLLAEPSWFGRLVLPRDNDRYDEPRRESGGGLWSAGPGRLRGNSRRTFAGEGASGRR